MTIKKCRVCKNDFFEEPLLKYENMPSVAQNLPDAKSLNEDKGVDIGVYQCSVCGLVQLDNEPVEYYRDVIRATGFSNEMKEFRFKQFKDFVQEYSLEDKKIIEIGCGRGEYLSLMDKFIKKTYGLEHLKDSVINGKKEKLRIIEGFIENEKDDIKNAPFDAFYIMNFLEHLPDTNSVLKGIRKNLTETAVGIVEVPNFDMMLKQNLFSEFTRDHLFYFTKKTLKSTLKQNGFDVVNCKEIWHDYIISAVVKKTKDINPKRLNKKLEKIDLSPFENHQKKITREINDYIDKIGENNVAIWGAGHQAFAIMSLANLSGKVRYVVDSAPFKQGLYTPATHIPIVSPMRLDTNPVDAVIIMAGSYSDEIYRIIKGGNYKNLGIAILRNLGLEEVR